MCNQITLDASKELVADYFKARRPKSTNAGTGDVWKGGTGFVVRETSDGRIMQTMHWGFPRHSTNKRTGEPNKPTPVNNARDDKLMSPRGMWHRWFTMPAHRCLIPITAFAEAVGPEGKMTRTWISIADQPIAACAGLWCPTYEWGDAYTMVMVDAVPEMMEIHDRMPVILHPRDHDAWLRASADNAMELVTQYPADQLIVQHTDQPWYAGRRKAEPAPTLI